MEIRHRKNVCRRLEKTKIRESNVARVVDPWHLPPG